LPASDWLPDDDEHADRATAHNATTVRALCDMIFLRGEGVKTSGTGAE
jgi:hypothetical protein